MQVKTSLDDRGSQTTECESHCCGANLTPDTGRDMSVRISEASLCDLQYLQFCVIVIAIVLNTNIFIN